MPVMATELDARTLVKSLAGRQIRTVTGRPNTVLGLDDTNVIVGTTRSPNGELVPTKAVQNGIDRLAEAGGNRSPPFLAGLPELVRGCGAADHAWGRPDQDIPAAHPAH